MDGAAWQGAVDRLRAAGCVHAEDEADRIWETYDDPADRDGAVARRVGGEPLEQVVGWAEFGPVRVALAPGVFVPRRRAEAILGPAIAARPDARVVVDLGCGAGALAAALAHLLPDAAVHGTEIDADALACARLTAAGKFAVHEGSWWSALPTGLAGRVDLAVAYLPHVPTERLADIHPDFRAHEPDLSVDGGPDGLDPLRAVLVDARAWLAADGAFVTLLSTAQADALGSLDLHGFATEVLARDHDDDGDDDAVVAFHPA